MQQYKHAAKVLPRVINKINEEIRITPNVSFPALFAGLSQREYQSFMAFGRAREYSRGEILYLEGESASQVILLTSGLVKLSKFGVSGAEVILGLSVPGDVLGVADPIYGNAYRATALAFRHCEALLWEASAFRVLMEPYPKLHQNLARILSRNLLELGDRFREMAAEKVAARLARQIVRLAEQIGRPVQGGTEISLSREELAQMTGTTLFTVSRQLSAWETLAILKPRREAVEIANIEALRAISTESLKRAG